MSTTRARQEAMLLLCATVAQDLTSKSGPFVSPHVIARKVYELSRIARSLHKRYEAACSYEWAQIRAYEERTERLEARALLIGDDLGIIVEVQQDPRGWPLIIYSRGGKSNTNPPSYTDQHEIGRLG